MRSGSVVKIVSARSDNAPPDGLQPDQRCMLACSLGYGVVAVPLVVAGVADIGFASLAKIVLQLLAAALLISACLLCGFAGLVGGGEVDVDR